MKPRSGPLLALAAATLLAGCGSSPPPTPSSPAFSPTCPNWIFGPGGASYVGSFASSHNDTHFRDHAGVGFLSWHGYPLDQMQFDFSWETNETGHVTKHGIAVEDGTLTGAFRREDDGQPAFAFATDNPAGPRSSWAYKPGLYQNFTLQLNLARPGEPVHPAVVDVDWDFARNLDGNPTTPSAAVTSYKVHFLYRTCNADGSSTMGVSSSE